MIELKVGDRVRVYGHIKHIEHPNYFLSFNSHAEITYIYRDILSIKLLDGPINIYECHRKQVRKLVKVRKYDECDGSGMAMSGWENPPCEKCNGKGKIPA